MTNAGVRSLADEFGAVHVTPAPWIVGTLAAVGLVGTSVRYAVVEDPLGLITAVAFTAVAVGGARALRRFYAARRQAEENPRPPEAAPWGEYHPHQAPITGWAAQETA